MFPLRPFYNVHVDFFESKLIYVAIFFQVAFASRVYFSYFFKLRKKVKVRS
jgi:hypothetical protein